MTTRLSVPTAIFGPLLYVGGVWMFVVSELHWHNFQLPSFVMGVGAALIVGDLYRWIRGRLVAQAKLQWQAGAENYEATQREAGEAQALCVEALCKGDSLGSVAQQRIRDGHDFDETMRAYTAACRLKWKAEQLGH